MRHRFAGGLEGPCGGAGWGASTGKPVRYRSEIDGLRAVSVLGVVSYHAAPRTITGGFVGVDVFFVISGFLITSNILADHAAGRFSILGFYEKRARRLLPALAAVLIATTLAALLLLPPRELTEYARSLLGVSGFFSNVHFYKQTGYFAPLAADQPLLHTWSLAVEEQFYIVWPLVVAFAVRGRSRLLRPLIWTATALSLAAAQWELARDPAGSFYLVPFRAWELGLGALLAVGALPKPRRSAAELLSALGLGMIVGAMLLFDQTTPFPGFAAALPCVGAVLFLHATQGTPTVTAKVMSLRPTVFVGLISYSLYLWHWPVLVLGRAALARPLAGATASGAVMLALCLAALSWRFVERPFRARGFLSRATVLRGGATFLAVSALAGVGLIATNGLRAYASADVLAAERDEDSKDWTCLAPPKATAPIALSRCVHGGRSDAYDVLLWGDSHANHIAPGLAEVANARGLTIREASEGACQPSFEAATAGSPECAAFNRAVLAEARRQRGLRLIIVSARWTKLIDRIVADDSTFERTEARLEPVLRSTLRVIRRSFGPEVQIVVIGSTPEFDTAIARCFARLRHQGSGTDACERRTPMNSVPSNAGDAAIVRVAAHIPGVRVYLPRSLFCDGELCRTREGDTVLVRDDHHLTNAGGRLIAERLFATVDGTGAEQSLRPLTGRAPR